MNAKLAVNMIKKCGSDCGFGGVRESQAHWYAADGLDEEY